jgi:hypothetical protein
MLVMINGREVERIVGAQPKTAIKDTIERAIAGAGTR